jgi:methyl-accepting chemotaxis protein
MLNFLSSTQRAMLTLALLVAGQACVAIGVNAGWSATAVIASSLTLTATGAAIYLSGLSVLRNFLTVFSGHARRLAEGDLSVDITIEGGNSDSAAVLRSLQTLQTELRRSISAIRTGADGVTVAATEIASGNQDLSQRTEQTASNLQQAASSMSQLNGTVRQSADAASQANQLASSATQVARRGGEVVSQVVTTMDEINASSKKIADIIGVIDGIAFQTNILALNAAVEAARAGEQGRGFAVVAGEVRSLAGRSAEAAREIKTLIGASVDRVESGTRLVQDAGATMNEIVSSVQRVSDIIGEISAGRRATGPDDAAERRAGRAVGRRCREPEGTSQPPGRRRRQLPPRRQPGRARHRAACRCPGAGRRSGPPGRGHGRPDAQAEGHGAAQAGRAGASTGGRRHRRSRRLGNLLILPDAHQHLSTTP